MRVVHRRAITARGIVASLSWMMSSTMPSRAGVPQGIEARCLEETAVPGAYINPCMQDPSRVFEWPTTGRITIEQGAVGPGSTGAAVWTAGNSLSAFLATEGGAMVRGRRCIELGCGTGLCGIVAARLGATEVLLTDGNTLVCERARANVERNVQPSTACSVRLLTWSETVDTDLQGKFDVVLASDVLYQASAWRPLTLCAKELLRPGGSLLLAEAGHELTPAAASVTGFRACAEGAGLVVEEELEADSLGATLLLRARAVR